MASQDFTGLAERSPDAHGAVVAGGDQRFAVRHESDAVHFGRVTTQRANHFTLKEIPNADGAIIRDRGHLRRARERDQATDPIELRVDGSHLVAGRKIPDTKSMVVGRGYGSLAIGKKGDGTDRIRVPGERSLQNPALQVPDLEGVVI